MKAAAKRNGKTAKSKASTSGAMKSTTTAVPSKTGKGSKAAKAHLAGSGAASTASKASKAKAKPAGTKAGRKGTSKAKASPKQVMKKNGKEASAAAKKKTQKKKNKKATHQSQSQEFTAPLPPGGLELLDKAAAAEAEAAWGASWPWGVSNFDDPSWNYEWWPALGSSSWDAVPAPGGSSSSTLAGTTSSAKSKAKAKAKGNKGDALGGSTSAFSAGAQDPFGTWGLLFPGSGGSAGKGSAASLYSAGKNAEQAQAAPPIVPGTNTIDTSKLSAEALLVLEPLTQILGPNVDLQPLANVLDGKLPAIKSEADLDVIWDDIDMLEDLGLVDGGHPVFDYLMQAEMNLSKELEEAGGGGDVAGTSFLSSASDHAMDVDGDDSVELGSVYLYGGGGGKKMGSKNSAAASTKMKMKTMVKAKAKAAQAKAATAKANQGGSKKESPLKEKGPIVASLSTSGSTSSGAAAAAGSNSYVSFFTNPANLGAVFADTAASSTAAAGEQPKAGSGVFTSLMSALTGVQPSAIPPPGAPPAVPAVPKSAGSPKAKFAPPAGKAAGKAKAAAAGISSSGASALIPPLFSKAKGLYAGGKPYLSPYLFSPMFGPPPGKGPAAAAETGATAKPGSSLSSAEYDAAYQHGYQWASHYLFGGDQKGTGKKAASASQSAAGGGKGEDAASAWNLAATGAAAGGPPSSLWNALGTQLSSALPSIFGGSSAGAGKGKGEGIKGKGKGGKKGKPFLKGVVVKGAPPGLGLPPSSLYSGKGGGLFGTGTFAGKGAGFTSVPASGAASAGAGQPSTSTYTSLFDQTGSAFLGGGLFGPGKGLSGLFGGGLSGAGKKFGGGPLGGTSSVAPEDAEAKKMTKDQRTKAISAGLPEKTHAKLGEKIRKLMQSAASTTLLDTTYTTEATVDSTDVTALRKLYAIMSQQSTGAKNKKFAAQVYAKLLEPTLAAALELSVKDMKKVKAPKMRMYAPWEWYEFEQPVISVGSHASCDVKWPKESDYHFDFNRASEQIDGFLVFVPTKSASTGTGAASSSSAKNAPAAILKTDGRWLYVDAMSGGRRATWTQTRSVASKANLSSVPTVRKLLEFGSKEMFLLKIGNTTQISNMRYLYCNLPRRELEGQDDVSEQIATEAGAVLDGRASTDTDENAEQQQDAKRKKTVVTGNSAAASSSSASASGAGKTEKSAEEVEFLLPPDDGKSAAGARAPAIAPPVLSEAESKGEEPVICEVCMESVVDLRTLPCRHTCLCSECLQITAQTPASTSSLVAALGPQCPLCRATITRAEPLIWTKLMKNIEEQQPAANSKVGASAAAASKSGAGGGLLAASSAAGGGAASPGTMLKQSLEKQQKAIAEAMALVDGW
eukprot:g109.t1